MESSGKGKMPCFDGRVEEGNWKDNKFTGEKKFKRRIL
jgi:hypothetical protein